MNKLIIIGSSGITIAIALLLVWPQYQKLQALKSDVELKKQDLQSQQAYFSQFNDISVRLQEYPDALSKISDALPKDPALASLVSFLQTNSSQTGLILKKIVLGGTAALENKKSLKETQLVIQVSGSYQSFKDFIALIENSSRIIDVQNISIEIPSKTSKESPTYTLDLKTTSY